MKAITARCLHFKINSLYHYGRESTAMLGYFYFGFIISFGASFLALFSFYEPFNVFVISTGVGLIYGGFCALFHRNPFNPTKRE